MNFILLLVALWGVQVVWITYDYSKAKFYMEQWAYTYYCIPFFGLYKYLKHYYSD